MESKKLNDRVMEFRFSRSTTNLPPILGATDTHLDSKYSDRKLLRRHMKEIADNDGYIFFNGDLFDVMGCEKDPRTKHQDIDPKYLHPDRSYLDMVIDDIYEYLKPFASRILFMGYGNHETAIMKYRDTDPIRRVVNLLNQAGGNILLSQYDGFADFVYENDFNQTRRFHLYHHHGYGGNAKRSKGVLNVDINSQAWPMADVIFTGHIHQKWYVAVNRMDIKANKELHSKKQWHLCGGHYKDTSNKGFGWEKQKGFVSNPTGGWFIQPYIYGTKRELKLKIFEAD